MSSEALLAEINAIMGVRGCFLIGPDGGLWARALPQPTDEASLQWVGRVLGQTLTAMERARRRKPGDLDLVFSAGRFILKPLGGAALIILCNPRVNVALLNLSANLVARNLQASLRGQAPIPPAPAPSRSERMRAAVEAELGEHAAQAVEILASAGDDPAALARAATEIEDLMRLFIDRRRAAETGRNLRSILSE